MSAGARREPAPEACAPAAVRCEGAPRDLGWDQGRALRARIRAAGPAAPGAGARGLLRLRLAKDAPEVRVHRDLGRFFPHLSERLLGLARGAGLPATHLTARLARRAAAPAADRERVAAIPRAREGAGPLLGRGVAGPAAERLVLRESVPESDFRSLEVVAFDEPGAVAGVNEHGLAAAAVTLPAAPETLRACAAPASLLVQECLQRFDALEAALAWCQRRPAGGLAALLLADAWGRAARVVVEGARREVRAAEGEVLVGPAPADGAERMAKRLRERGVDDAEGLGAALRAEGAVCGVLLDPAGRRIGLDRGDGAPAWAVLSPGAEEA